MKNMKRIWAMLLTVLLLCGSLSPAVSAADMGSHREYRPETVMPTGPQWTEQEITCQSGSNTLRGTMTVPEDSQGQMPVAILLHGLNTDRSWCDNIAWILADNGIASVRFDYSGNGVSDGQQWEMSVSSLVRDTRAMIDYVRRLAITDQENIFVVGKSMGAVAAMMATKSEGEHIRAMCLWYPGFDIKNEARRGFLLGCPYNTWFPPETLMVGGFYYGRDFLKEIQIMDYESACQEYEGPVMIIHGTDDFVVPIASSFAAEQLFQDVQLRVVPGGGHGFYGFQEILALNDMLAFFQEQLG